ncbi:pPIWI_RE module domain-containing protein [Risungbinella massiliensis]|uniref:pPIWI_RE module domain-containing protein n=1 Tax=Risungbinella massiliensis TaxID=1329796 RepID=UPI0005CC1F99|nr:DUF3962 domain-containing protein [Risungbinella massiliensis]
MSSQDNFLELMSVEVTNYVPDKPLYFLYCPKSWSAEVKKQSQTTNYELEFRLTRLGEELYQMYPDLLSYSFKHAVFQGKSPMFVSLRPISIDEIAEHFRRHGRQVGKRLFFNEQMAEWLLGDAASIKDNIFDWLPAYFARQFVEKQPLFDVANENGEIVERLKFFLVKRNPVGCMTELYSKGGKYYSYGVNFTIETFPNQSDRTFLFIKPVHHRFITRKINDKKQVRSKKDGSIFVRRNLSNLHPFISLPVSKDMDAKDGEPVLKWRDRRTVEYLNLFLGKELSLSNLLQDPMQYINMSQEATACILYNPNTFVKGNDVIELGLGLPERKRLYHLVHQTLDLPPSLTTEKTLFNRGKGYHLFPLVVNEPTQLDIQCHVSKVHYDTLNEVLLNRSNKKKNHLSFECESLGDGSFAFQANQHPLVINLHHIPDSYVVREIDPAKPLDSVDLIRKYIQLTKKHIKNSSAAIIDIKEKKKWKEIDPKEFVRYAFWNEKMLSQFLVDDDNDIEYRVHNALLDLLKDFGIYSGNLLTNDQDTWLFVRGNSISSLPKVMISRYKNHRIDYLLQDSKIGWNSLQNLVLNPDGLRRSLKSKKNGKEKVINEATIFIERILEDELTCSDSNVYVIFDRGSLTKMYKSVDNNRLSDGNWKFVNNELSFNERLKIIRMTNSTQRGVPEYISHLKGKEEHFISGLYFLDGRFYSLAPKGDLIQESPKRERSYFDKSLRQPDLLEFFPVGNHRDLQEKELSISQLHYWRRASVSFKESTIAPAPMHTLGTLRKYMDMHSKVNKVFTLAETSFKNK